MDAKKNYQKESTVDVVIPVYRPDRDFANVLKRLMMQSVLPERIIIMYTEEERKKDSRKECYENIVRLFGKEDREFKNLFVEKLSVYGVLKEDFDHGKTRDTGAEHSHADYLLFMTQDAVPADRFLIEKLLKGFQKEKTGICYGRQLPRKEADVVEQMTRIYNYPEESFFKTAESEKELGIKTYFCSDVCAMYDRKLYRSLGGFVHPTIFNEDMIMAYKVVQAGYGVFYAADAKVIHSHSYTCMQQFHRNFDLGVSQKQYEDVFKKISSEKEGAGYAKKLLLTLIKKGHFLKAFYFAWQCGFRLFGYQLGKHYNKLPRALVMFCTTNKNYVLFKKHG